MDDGKKQRLIMAGLTVLSLGAGSYFMFSGKSGPPPDGRKAEARERPSRPKAAPDDTPRTRRVTAVQKPVAQPRRVRKIEERRTKPRISRSKGRTTRRETKRKQPRGL